MAAKKDVRLTRRDVLTASPAAPTVSLLNSVCRPAALGAVRALEPTPACADGDDITPPQTAGPFFKPRSPERNSLIEPEMRGARIVLEGHVLTSRCKPVPGALVDFWQADASGAYDNAGYTLRGHQFTDDRGRYRLETIVPGLYPGRTRHFHVRVQAPKRPVLTTQLYFPGEPENKRDRIFHPKLVIALSDSASGKAGGFDFILNLG